MRIHHFFPRTRNLGDHFVQLGISRMIREIVPEATFELRDVNSRGREKLDYGLTRSAIERANSDADLIVVGGSNLYEGAVGWPWGVHLDLEALEKLRVPLVLLGIGTGSSFGSPLHKPSARATLEIKALNDQAILSGARDVTTLEWLHQLGVTKAKLLGDPATFIFNYPQQTNHGGYVLIAIPPRRIWSSTRQFFKVQTIGRAVFIALRNLTQTLLEKGDEVVVVCNDPMDLPVAERLFRRLPSPVICPETPEAYFELLSKSRAVITGRLHTAVVAFSLGLPFLLVDIDQRTHGFLRTYQLESASLVPTRSGFDVSLARQADQLLADAGLQTWQAHIEKRDQMYRIAMNLLQSALKSIG